MDTSSPIIAVLTDQYLHYQASIVECIARELKTAGYGTLCITGRELAATNQPHQIHSVCNAIYPEIEKFPVKGHIVLSGTLGYSVEPADLTDFLDRYNLPKVSLGINVPEVTSVYLDDLRGMSDLMDQLLSDKTRRRFAFVRGYPNDPYSFERESIFLQSLQRAGLDEHDVYFIEGNYDAFATYRGVTELLKRIDYLDCIVAANDVMAAAAARAAKAAGLIIPKDIAISGFDDTSEAIRHSPALTTVRQPLVKMAQRSVELLLHHISQTNELGEPGDKPLINSIGMSSELVVRASTRAPESNVGPNLALTEPQLRALLEKAMCGLDAPKKILMQHISEPFWAAIYRGSSELINLFTKHSYDIQLQDIHWWSNLCDQIETIATQMLPEARQQVQLALIRSTTAIVKERIWALEMDREFETSRMHNIRANMQLQMSSCTDIEDVIVTLERWLMQIKPSRCFLVRYQHPGPEPDRSAELLHVHRKGGTEQVIVGPFASCDVLPEQYHRELLSGLLILSPIYAGNDLFGYLLMDPTELNMPEIEAAAHCIGNAMRTQHHIAELQLQKRSLQSVNKELAHLANFDSLTGLANRLHFQKYLDSCCLDALETDSKFELLFIDLDGFKVINDTLGHGAGDQLLLDVSLRIQKVVSELTEYSGFISRLGGDEFTIILKPKSDSADIKHASQRILSLLSSPYTLEKNTVVVSASIGCAAFPETAIDAGSIVRHADSAMYRAKQNGKNSVAFFSSEMSSVNVQNLNLVQELREALECDELQMHFQPRVDLKTGKIGAVEGLMRWLVATPNGEVVRAYPDVFIASAERFGLINQVDTYALHYCCRQAAMWSEAGTPLRVSVNVSVTQLQHQDFVTTVSSAIEQYQLNPALLELEITESAAMTDVDNNIRKLSILKDMGIELSIDDFGTGYSSLNYLKQLPVTSLKIDRSFIQDIEASDGGSSADAAIVRSVVALGKSMDFGLIAEGIETQCQHDFVQSLGCDQAQGYFYAKPSPAAEITAMLHKEARTEKAA